METIVLKDVSKKFGKKEVLKNINFTINQGDIVGYLGPNGSGKTTTINLIMGLRKANKGTIEVLNHNVNNSYDDLYGKVGVLFDENGLYERLTAGENIEYFLNLFNVDRNENKTFLSELFEDSGFESLKNIEVRKMSKGMKRMVALIRALIIKPEILMLDEPFDGIDIENRIRFINIIKKYHSSHNPTIILTSHIMADIEVLASRIIILKLGEMLYNCSLEKFHNLTKIDNKSVSINNDISIYNQSNGDIKTLTDVYIEILNQDYKEEIN